MRNADVTVKPWLDGAELTGRFRATVEQVCGVSLDAFEQPLDGDIDIRVVPAGSPHASASEGGEMELDPDAPDAPDVLDGDAIDVAGDQVAAEAGSGHQRLLEVDRIPDLGGRKTGAGEGLQRDVCGIALVTQGDHGEADTVGGDGISQLDVAEVQGRRVHGEGHVLPLAAQLYQGSHRFDNSGKHADHLADDGGDGYPREH